MKKLNKEIDKLVYITIMDGNEAVYVETIDSSKTVRLVVKVNTRAPPLRRFSTQAATVKQK